MNINHLEGYFSSPEDDLSAAITSPMFRCDVCKAEVPDALCLAGHIGRHGFRMHHCQHHTYEEVLETIRQIPIQNKGWLEGGERMPSRMEVG